MPVPKVCRTCCFMLSNRPRSCLTPTREALATREALTLVHSWDKCIYSLTGVTGVHGAHTQAQIDVLD